MTDGGESKCYNEELKVDARTKWDHAMDEEMNTLIINQKWDLVPLLIGKNALDNKWVYRLKEEHDGSMRYKAMLVVKGYQQRNGVDYSKLLSMVVKMITIRMVVSIVVVEDLHLKQLDVKTFFLYGDLKEDIYMQ